MKQCFRYLSRHKKGIAVFLVLLAIGACFRWEVAEIDDAATGQRVTSHHRVVFPLDALLCGGLWAVGQFSCFFDISSGSVAWNAKLTGDKIEHRHQIPGRQAVRDLVARELKAED
jgi:hypothetical protein